MSPLDWAIELALARKGSKKQWAGEYVLLNAGPDVVSFLVKAATGPERKRAHRLRLLDLIQRAGGPLSAQDCADLFAMSREASPTVHDKVIEVLTSLCPDGAPPAISDEDMKPIMEVGHAIRKAIQRGEFGFPATATGFHAEPGCYGR